MSNKFDIKRFCPKQQALHINKTMMMMMMMMTMIFLHVYESVKEENRLYELC
jgi:hypothetical protein